MHQRKGTHRINLQPFKADDMPWSEDSDTPAPRPHNISMNWYIFKEKQKQHIGVAVSWIQKSSDFKQKYVLRGYYIEVASDSGVRDGYNCNVAEFDTNDTFATFHFNDPRGVNCPGRSFKYKIGALPMHTRGDTPSTVCDDVLIPDCCDDIGVEQTDECLSWNCGKQPKKCPEVAINGTPASTDAIDNVAATPDDIPTSGDPVVNTTALERDSDGMKPTHIILIASALFFAVVTVCVVIWRKRAGRGKGKTSVITKRRILLVGDVCDQRSVKVANELTELLRMCGGAGIAVTTNVRDQTDIGRIGIIEWMTKKTNEADIVVLVTDSLSETSDIPEGDNGVLPVSHVSVAFQSSKAIMLKSGAEVMRKKLMAVVDTFTRLESWEEEPAFCDLFSLKSDLKKIVQHALGTYFHRRIFEENEDRAIEIFSRTSVDDSEMYPEIPDEQNRSLGNSNNLNVAPACRSPRTPVVSYQNEETPLLTWNIAYDDEPQSTERDPSSMECNE